MLPLHLEFGVEETSCSMRGAIARDAGVYSATMRDLVYDNRCIPRRKAGEVRWRLICLVRRGELRFGSAGDAVGPGAPFVAVDRMFAPIEEASVPVRSHGATFAMMAVRLHPALFVDAEPGQPALLPNTSNATKEQLIELGAAADAGRTEELADRLRAFAQALAGDGIVDRAALDSAITKPDEPSVRRAGEAMFPVLFNLASRPMMVDLVSRAGVTERQMLRDIQKLQEDYDLFDRGWRDAVVRWRVTAAAVLLSSAGMTTGEIARLVGYASSTAMGRAFREAGLPSPRDVRKKLAAGAF